MAAVSDTSSVSYDRPPRTIVLCFDGTNGKYDSTNTNVVKFFGFLRKDCPEQQVTYYQAGIGTYFAPGVVSPLFTWLASLMDQAVAWYLDAHVMAGYKFIMDNYRPGDKICLFGFSRGAYTARALAGMLDKVGLLPKDNFQQVGFAYKAYTRTDKEGIELAAGFKRTFSRDVRVDFVGVWDTVQSTGVLVNRVLPFTGSNTDIRVFRQALSLDEHRSRFRPNLYHWPVQDNKPNEVAGLRRSVTKRFDTVKSTCRRFYRRKYPGLRQQAVSSGHAPDGAQRSVCAKGGPTNSIQSDTEFTVDKPFQSTDVLEVWFSGCHSDIGGGDVHDDVEVSLAQIPLHWMVEQVIESKCGVVFYNDQLSQIGLEYPSFTPHQPISFDQESPNDANQPTPSLGTYPESSDAVAPLFDQLKLNKLWWILEFIPSSNAWQDSSGVWHNEWSINFGRGRFIPSERPKFHHTVKERMEYAPLKYKPRATYDHHEVYV